MLDLIQLTPSIVSLMLPVVFMCINKLLRVINIWTHNSLYKKRRVKDSFTRKLDGRVNKYYKIPPDVLFLLNPPFVFKKGKKKVDLGGGGTERHVR